MLRWLLIFFLVMVAFDRPVDNALTTNVIEFNVRWNKFFRTYFGCPAEAREVKECNPVMGRLDYQEFLHARRAAKKLFDLEEKKNAPKAR